jgi:hypothetical protein
MQCRVAAQLDGCALQVGAVFSFRDQVVAVDMGLQPCQTRLQMANWSLLMHGMHPLHLSCCVVQVTDDRLDAYHQSFRGSEEERKELLELYERMDGDMKKVMEWLPCSDVKLDSHRFLDAISAAIKAGEVKQTAAFRAWCKKTAQTPRPKEPLKPKKRTNKADAESSDALIAAIQKRVCLDTRTVHCQLESYKRHVSCL